MNRRELLSLSLLPFLQFGHKPPRIIRLKSENNGRIIIENRSNWYEETLPLITSKPENGIPTKDGIKRLINASRKGLKNPTTYIIQTPNGELGIFSHHDTIKIDKIYITDPQSLKTIETLYPHHIIHEETNFRRTSEKN